MYACTVQFHYVCFGQIVVRRGGCVAMATVCLRYTCWGHVIHVDIHVHVYILCDCNNNITSDKLGALAGTGVLCVTRIDKRRGGGVKEEGRQRRRENEGGREGEREGGKERGKGGREGRE